MTSHHLQRAARCLQQGGIVAYPTEGVFGLGCDPLDETAVNRLLALKQRHWRKGLILIAAGFEHLEPFLLPLSAEIQAKVTATWPGPVTWLLPARPVVPSWLRGAHTTLAVRVTAHPPALALCKAWGGALVSTSANISNRPAARTALRVRQYFGTGVDDILPGRVGEQRGPTQIRDGYSDGVVRAGTAV